jgi:hypothetical protein
MTTRRKCQIETGVFVKNETGVDTRLSAQETIRGVTSTKAASLSFIPAPICCKPT